MKKLNTLDIFIILVSAISQFKAADSHPLQQHFKKFVTTKNSTLTWILFFGAIRSKVLFAADD